MNKISIPHGWLFIDKPENIGSTTVLNYIKGAAKVSKIGHTGTLDPFATGMLMVAIGEATKIIPYISDWSKSYYFSVKWGVETNTLDYTGDVVATSLYCPTLLEIQSIIKDFMGIIQQVPPKFSAIKVKGRRAYQLARNNEEFSLKSREVQIIDLKIISHNTTTMTTEFMIDCSKGTYIRAIARDFAYKLGTYAHLIALRRLRLGKYQITHTISLASFLKMLHTKSECDLRPAVLPIHAVLDDILVHHISEAESYNIRLGQKIVVELFTTSDQLVATFCNNQFVALCCVQDGFLKPIRVFNYL